MNTRRLLTIGGSLAFAISQIVFPGCATISGGATKPIAVHSKQERARVFINGKLRGTAPLTTQVSRWGSHRIRIEAPGYKPCEFRLAKHYNENTGGNLFIGIAPIAIDLVTGAVFDLTVPKKALKSNGHEIIRIQPRPMFDSTLAITVDLEPLSPR